ncbi:MAG TPA: hypothetical protein VIX90_06860 [Edaphobacter sp.]
MPIRIESNKCPAEVHIRWSLLDHHPFCGPIGMHGFNNVAIGDRERELSTATGSLRSRLDGVFRPEASITPESRANMAKVAEASRGFFLRRSA